MQLFCGKSVGTLDEVEGNSIPSTNTTGVETSDTLEWGSSKWDLENNCLVSRPAVKTGKVGMLCNADRRNIISISWTEDKAQSKHDGIVVDPTDVVLGTLTLKLPVVYFRGNQICEDVVKLIEKLE